MLKKLWSMILVLSASTVSSVYAQGSLEPSAPPNPSMKTLDQVEPRYPIDTPHFTIEKSGSYYLTRNLEIVVTNEHGIIVAADDVVLDLNGFAIVGYAGGAPFYDSGSAILQSNQFRNLTLKNGSIFNMNGQQHANVGMVELLGNNNRIQNITLRYCSRGLRTGEGSLIEHCVAQDLDEGGFGENFGFMVGPGSSVRQCVAENISGNLVFGYHLGANSVIEQCVARSNKSISGQAIGFYLYPQCVAIGCNAQDNTTKGFMVSEAGRVSACAATRGKIGFELWEGASAIDCSASGCSTGGFWAMESGILIERCTARSSFNGIVVDSASVVRDCVAENNDYQGIDVRSGRNVIRGNTCAYNVSSGIFVWEDANRIEDNHLVGNDYGLYFRYWAPDSLADLNIAVKNTAMGNLSEAFHVGVSNSVAPIEGLDSFTNPWANFSL